MLKYTVQLILSIDLGSRKFFQNLFLFIFSFLSFLRSFSLVRRDRTEVAQNLVKMPNINRSKWQRKYFQSFQCAMIIWIFGSYAFLKTIIKYSSCLSFYLSFSYGFSRRSFRLWSFLRNSYITGILEVYIFIITIIIECFVILVMFFVHSKVWCIAMQRFKIKILQIKRIIVMKVTRLSWHCSAWEGVFLFF